MEIVRVALRIPGDLWGSRTRQLLLHLQHLLHQLLRLLLQLLQLLDASLGILGTSLGLGLQPPW